MATERRTSENDPLSRVYCKKSAQQYKYRRAARTLHNSLHCNPGTPLTTRATPDCFVWSMLQSSIVIFVRRALPFEGPNLCLDGRTQVSVGPKKNIQFIIVRYQVCRMMNTYEPEATPTLVLVERRICYSNHVVQARPLTSLAFLRDAESRAHTIKGCDQAFVLIL